MSVSDYTVQYLFTQHKNTNKYFIGMYENKIFYLYFL